MAIEALVTALCVGGYKCETALKAYYEQNQNVKRSVKEVSKDISSTEIGKAAVYSAPAIISLATRGEAHIRITKMITTKISEDSMQLLYGFTF